MYTHTHMLTQTVECEITNPTDLETERLLTVTVHLGNQLEPVGMIKINEPLNLLVILIPIFAGMIFLSGGIFVMVVAMLCRKTRQKAQEKDKLLSTLLQMEHRETEMASKSVRGEQHQNCNAYVRFVMVEIVLVYHL